MMKDKDVKGKNIYPRVLVVSHNCFSKTGSNGRTLGNFFVDWPKEALAQFYINNEISDSPVCDNYYRVLDTEALSAFYKGSKVGRIVNREINNDCFGDENLTSNTFYKRHRNKTTFNYIVRNFIWNSNRWRNHNFNEWVEKFNPDVVLLQLGDYSFMLRIALDIANEKKIPLVIYNSEDYYFKDRQSISLLYHYYRHDYKNQVRKLMAYASHSIYISDMLQDTYQKEFQHRSSVIMTSTNMKPIENKVCNSPLIVSYLGNLGVGRHEPLIEVANALHKVAPEVYLDIYGKILSDDVAQALRSCSGIRMKGFVSYDEVVKVMQHSDILVYAENFSDYYQLDLKHAFSTKIPDSLASGSSIFCYGPESIFSIKYLKNNNLACVVTNSHELTKKISMLIKNDECRKQYVENALAIAGINHNDVTNREYFREIMNDVVTHNNIDCPEMKVLQINTVYKEKSTGRTCLEVNKALEDNGYKGYVAYGKGKYSDKNAYRIGSDIEYYIHNIMARVTGLQGYFSLFATKRFIRYIKLVSPDIIHLRNLHANYLNLPQLFNFLKEANIPVVLNLHDCWALTGKCAHYTDIQCFKWKTCCFDCQVINTYPQSLFFDRTKKLYNDKKNWFANIRNLTVVAVSKWTTEQAKMSFLSDRKILTIYNWIDRNVFYPRQDNILSNYGFDVSKFTIVGVSTSWSVGSPRYEDFIKISNLIQDDMQIVLVGQSNVSKFPQNIKHIPFIHDINALAKLYSAADVYLHLSTEDTFGKVVAEAMACGTPVILYNSTALPELIAKGCGYVIEPRDVDGILGALYKIKDNGKAYYSEKCVLNVSKNFDYTQNTMSLIKLYESIIKEDKYEK